MGDETDRIRLKLAHKRWGPRRIAVTIVGFVVLALGLVMLVTPGPGLLGIALGLAILATEYVWAWRAKRYVERKAKETARRAKRRQDAAYVHPPLQGEDNLRGEPFPR